MRFKKYSWTYVFALLILCLSIYTALVEEMDQAKPEKLYYAVEIDGTLCGYSEVDISTMTKDNKGLTLLEERIFLMLSALGSSINTEIKLTCHIDPSTGNFTYYDSQITQGTTKIGYTVLMDGNTAKLVSTIIGEKTTELPKDVVLENTRIFPYLIKDFADEKESKTYPIYEPIGGEIQENTYTKIGTEELELAGEKYKAIIFDRMNQKTGLKLRWWINAKNGYILKTSYQNRVSYLADSSVVKKIKMTSETNVSKEAIAKKYEAYIGDYVNPDNNNVFKVLVQDGVLAVDVMGRLLLALNDPDEEGLWYSKINNRVYFAFNKDNSGKATEMIIHEVLPMQKQSDPEKVEDNVPEKFRPYLGKYLFVAMQAEFKVLYRDGSLAVDDPLAKKVVKFQPPDDKGRWLDEFNKNTIYFDLDDKGSVKSMNIDTIAKFIRKKD